VSVDIYPFASLLFRGGFHALGIDVRAVGAEHVPTTGPVVLASNHVGYLDFCFVALAPKRPRRRGRFVARRDVFTHPVAGPLMRSMRQVPADPFGDASAAVERSIDLLREGECVGIHPEGTISPSFLPRRGRTGAIRMAMQTGAAVVPVAVWGSQRLLTKGRPRNLRRGVAVRVHYGEPFHVAPDADPVEATAALMARITDLLRAAWNGYPQQPDGPEDRWWLPAELGGTAPTPAEAEARIAAQDAERRARRQAEIDGR
jgi:1-acyl-sn-glycerol-3-phosphate acyltransferase